jgi:type IV pilus assembly protein PilC
MPKFRCKIGLPEGRVVDKQFDAFSKEALKESLEAQGICVFRIRKTLSISWLGLQSGGRFGGRQFLGFNQEFLVLLKSGLPILDVLSTVSEQLETKNMREVLREIREEVKGGAKLSEAFGKYPLYFPTLYVASLRAGERSGDLPITIARYITYQKRTEAIRNKLRSASFYPILLGFAATVVLFFLLLYVIPSFSQIYADAQVQLPWLTRGLIGLAQFLLDYLLFLVPLSILLLLGLRRFIKSERGGEWLDRGKLAIPYFKTPVPRLCPDQFLSNPWHHPGQWNPGDFCPSHG